MAVDVGEAALDAVVVKGELFVVEAEEVEHRGVQVMEGMDVFGCLESELIGGTMADAGFDAGTEDSRFGACCEASGQSINCISGSGTLRNTNRYTLRRWLAAASGSKPM